MITLKLDARSARLLRDALAEYHATADYEENRARRKRLHDEIGRLNDYIAARIEGAGAKVHVKRERAPTPEREGE